MKSKINTADTSLSCSESGNNAKRQGSVKIFGITGPTGAGKSTVSELFRKCGVYIADADKAARCVMKKGSACLNELYREFGKDIFLPDGSLDRKRLGDIVFADPEKLILLNRISHKYIKAYLKREIEESGADLAAIDGAVLIGSPVMNMCSKLVVVTAEPKTRLERIIARDNISREAAEMRMAAQPGDEEYLKYADYVIDNNGQVQGEEIEQICNKIKAEKKAGTAAQA
ncbi:MAG: dephospho-CoA kinase [Clostridia bacterium]|nr:dephospho-CoA kinase [Clostridia bacterium]